jgi:uroporphyrin-3 C-methyltransferase
VTEVSASDADSGSSPSSSSASAAAKSDTPHVLDELSKKNGAKTNGRNRRRRRNGLQRFLIVLLLLAPLLLALGWLVLEQSATQEAIAQLQERTDTLGAQVANPVVIEQPSMPTDLVNSQTLDALRGNLEARINAVASAYANLQETVSASAQEREDPTILWTEAEYLLRLANQKLQLEGDKSSAILLLESVEQILAEADNPRFINVREAIAAELVAVRAMPSVDTSGLYVRIENLMPLVDQVVLRNSLQLKYAAEVAQNQANIKAGEAGVIDKLYGLLSSIFVWQKREEVLEPSLFAQDELMLKQNLRLMLEQSQLAMLQGEQVVFQSSLTKAGQWVSRFFTIESGAGRTIREELDKLAVENLKQERPDISRSLNLLRQARDQRSFNLSGGSN